MCCWSGRCDATLVACVWRGYVVDRHALWSIGRLCLRKRHEAFASRLSAIRAREQRASSRSSGLAQPRLGIDLRFDGLESSLVAVSGLSCVLRTCHLTRIA